jgi:outer membrane protein TolC
MRYLNNHVYCAQLYVLALLCVFMAPDITSAQDRSLSMREFVEVAAANDTVFEEILINQLALQYQQDLKLPPRDLVLTVRQDHQLLLDGNGDAPRTMVLLSKLFPMQGTKVSLGYSVNDNGVSDNRSSELNFSIAQPIAENAFGRATRLLDKIVGLEVDVARHQIIEAYEDYFALILSAYIAWYEAFENLKIGKESYRENQKLLKDIREREKKKIAYPIDVNKITLQVQAKEESLIRLREKYQASLNIIERSLRNAVKDSVVPQSAVMYDTPPSSYKSEFDKFKAMGRTYQILSLLERGSSLQVDKEADDLLPSVDLIVGYRRLGREYSFQDEDNIGFIGFEMKLPFDDQVQGAEYQISKITRDKQRLTTKNVDYKLREETKTLFGQIEREQKLLKIAESKIKLARAVLHDEAENYSFGRVTLNDYIRSVNALDENRFSRVAREAQLGKLIIEWLRLTDQLVTDQNLGIRGKDG